MSAEADPDLSSMTALVVDANEYHRAIAADILRSSGLRHVLGAATAAEGLDHVGNTVIGLILLEWMEGADGGLDFIRRVRQGGDGSGLNRAAPILMLSARRRKSDVEAARAAGADAYLMKPVSAGAIIAKLATVVMRPRAFINTSSYVGPCRRRRASEHYGGPRRRLSDQSERRAELAQTEDEVRTALARARVAALTAEATNLRLDDPDTARSVYASANELRQLAEDIEDKMLAFGAAQLVRYLEAMGATNDLDPEAVRTHVQALHQLAHLPNALAGERRDVATSLRSMVDKKLLRSAG